MAFLSILTLYNYDDTIFDQLELPVTTDLPGIADYIDNIVELDKDDLIEYICFNLAELSLVYTEPETMKGAIGVWSRVNKSKWVSLWETLLYKYNPIWNKDGTFTESSSGSKSGSGTSEMDGTVADTGSAGNTRTFNEQNPTSSTVSHAVTGYDTSTYSPDTQDSQSGTNNHTGTVTDAGTSGNTRTYDTTRTDRSSESSSGSITRTERGNIGVTMTQQMIEEQRRIVKFNMYDFICSEFKKHFCVMVY